MPITHKNRGKRTRKYFKKKSGGNSSNKKKSGSTPWENRFRGFDSSTYRRRKSVKKASVKKASVKKASSIKYEEGNVLNNINILHKILYILNSNHVAVVDPLMSRRDFIKNTGIKLIESYNNIQSIEKICKDLARYAKYADNVKKVNAIGTVDKNVFKEALHPLNDWSEKENKTYEYIRNKISDEEFNNLIETTLEYADYSQKELQKRAEDKREIERKAEQERVLAAQIANKEKKLSSERKKAIKMLYSSKGIEV
jgi:hypothetical protein